MELNKIINMDCLDYMPSLPDASVDMVIADPPYFRVKGEFDFTWKDYQGYLDWCRRWMTEAYRVLKDGGALYCYQQDINKVVDICCVLRECGFTLMTDIIWYYATGRPQAKCFRKEHEFILFCAKGTPAVFNQDDIRIPYETKDKRHNPAGKSCGTVWRESRVKPNYKVFTGHPTQKPTALSDRMVLASTREGDVVYIPFAGCGSEIESCLKYGRSFLATEIEEPYITDYIMKREGILCRLSNP